MASDTPDDTQNRKDGYEATARLLPIIQKSGMKIIAGTDAGYLNTYDYPGLAIHLELQKFVEYGLTPREALIASVINGPGYFGMEKEYGSVKVGKSANLLLLNSNPLESIQSTLDIEGVIKDGIYYSRSTLDQMLAEIKKWVAEKESE